MSTYGKAEIVSIVNFSGIFPAAGGTSVMVTNFDDASGACANISCHSNTNASWYTSGATDCVVCQVSASSIDPVTTNGSGAGDKHIAMFRTWAIRAA